MAVVVDNFKQGVSQRLELSDMDDATLARWIELPGAADEWAKRRYGGGEARHLPGKHNQKTHGHGGGSGDYTPGQWKVASREEAVTVAADAMFDSLNSPGGFNDSPLPLELLNDPPRLREHTRTVAESAMGETAWALTNGPHRIIGTEGKPDLKLAAHVDDLQARYPAKGSIRIMSDRLPAGVHGETDMETGYMRLHSDLGDRHGFPDEPPGWSPPMASKVSNREYVLTHEWGHRLESDGLKEKVGGENHMFYKVWRVQADASKVGGFSRYGETDEHESFAESFAEWALSRGTTANPAARVYAEAFGWGE